MIFWLSVDPTQVIGLFPGLLPSDFQKQLEYPDSKPDLKPSEVEKGYVALIEYLTQVGCISCIPRRITNRLPD